MCPITPHMHSYTKSHSPKAKFHVHISYNENNLVTALHSFFSSAGTNIAIPFIQSRHNHTEIAITNTHTHREDDLKKEKDDDGMQTKADTY